MSSVETIPFCQNPVLPQLLWSNTESTVTFHRRRRRNCGVWLGFCFLLVVSAAYLLSLVGIIKDKLWEVELNGNGAVLVWFFLVFFTVVHAVLRARTITTRLAEFGIEVEPEWPSTLFFLCVCYFGCSGIEQDPLVEHQCLTSHMLFWTKRQTFLWTHSKML